MPAFRFEALDASGKTVNGLVEADNPKAARTQLRAQQLVPLKVDVVVMAAEGAAQGATQLFARRVFNPTALASGPDNCRGWSWRACLWSAP